MVKILKNTTGSAVSVGDVGITIPANGQYTIPAQEHPLFSASSNVVSLVGAGTLLVNDGTNNLSISDGIDLIKGVFQKNRIIGNTDGALIGNINDALKVTHDPSRTTKGQKEFYFSVAEGNVPSYKQVYVHGNNGNIGSSPSDLWEVGGDYIFPSQAEALRISSTSALDTAVGTGCRTILIEGLNSAYQEIQELVTLNGTTPVITTQQFFRVHFVRCITGGATESNQGVITVKQNISLLDMCKINPGVGTSHLGIFTIPAGKTGFLLNATIVANKASNFNVKLITKPQGYCFQETASFNIGSGSFVYSLDGAYSIPEKTDVKIRVNTATGSGGASGILELIIKDNS
jgi:hypothetical protein